MQSNTGYENFEISIATVEAAKSGFYMFACVL